MRLQLMAVPQANAAAVASGDALEGQEPLKEVESLAITSESLNPDLSDVRFFFDESDSKQRI